MWVSREVAFCFSPFSWLDFCLLLSSGDNRKKKQVSLSVPIAGIRINARPAKGKKEVWRSCVITMFGCLWLRCCLSPA